MTKKKIKIGDVIKVKTRHAKELRSRFEEIKGLQNTITDLSATILKMQKDVCGFINDLYPEYEMWKLIQAHKEED